jgi:hypothetical protein
MSFLGKVKQNLKHGGVKISVAAPPQVAKDEQQITVQATIASNDSPRTIKSVTATLERHYMSNGNNGAGSDAVISNQIYNTPFILAAGQSVSLSFQLNTTAVQDNPALEAASKIFSVADKMINQSQQRQYIHRIAVVADVDGIAIDPKASQQISLEGQEQNKFIKFNIS